ncbi:MAG TPA: transcriptional repressor [Bacillota bacterium]|nr:transcriptional repressor [Bacillota bacterium]
MPIQRNTIQRALVLDAVRSLKNHPTTDMVCEYVRRYNPAISRSTVYRNLNLLCEEGHLLRIPVPNAADHIDHRIDPHYHAVCRKCGHVFDVELKEGGTLTEDPSCLCDSVSAKGLKLEDCFVLFSGICDGCAANEAEAGE